MKRIIITTLMLLALGILSTQAEIHVILVGQNNGFTFSPSTLSVSVGDTVRFNWVSGSHTTTSLSVPQGAASWNSSITSGVIEFDYKVTEAGSYQYQCNPHGAAGMKGSFTASVVTDVNDKFYAINKSIVLSPNPAQDQTALNFNSTSSFKGYVRIFDAIGVLVLEEKIKVENGDNSIVVRTAALKPGLYYVNLFNKDDSFLVRKLIKQ